MFLKEKIKKGMKVYGTILRIIRNPSICYIAKNSGLDFLLYDCEHSNYNLETLHDLFIIGNILGIGSIIRVPELTKGYISRALDQGANGVMVPMIESQDMVKDLIKFSKYKPIGNRGFFGAGAHTGYEIGRKHADIIKSSNDLVIAIAQIETRTAVENIDTIASTAGLDAIIVGPNDLSLSLGIPGDIFNRIEIEAIEHVAATCKKYNLAFGLHGNVKLLEKFERDLNIVLIQSDIDIMYNGFKGIKQVCIDL